MTRSSGLPGFNVQWPVLPSMPPSMPLGATVCLVERREKRASLSRTSYSRTKPKPPRNRPGPPESGISSKRLTRVANSDSMISIGAILALDWFTLVPETPSLPLRPPEPPPKISYCT